MSNLRVSNTKVEAERMQKVREKAYSEFKSLCEQGGFISLQCWENSRLKSLQKDKDGNFILPKGYNTLFDYLKEQNKKFNEADIVNEDLLRKPDGKLSFEEYLRMSKDRIYKFLFGFKL